MGGLEPLRIFKSITSITNMAQIKHVNMVFLVPMKHTSSFI